MKIPKISWRHLPPAQRSVVMRILSGRDRDFDESKRGRLDVVVGGAQTATAIKIIHCARHALYGQLSDGEGRYFRHLKISGFNLYATSHASP